MTDWWPPSAKDLELERVTAELDKALGGYTTDDEINRLKVEERDAKNREEAKKREFLRAKIKIEEGDTVKLSSGEMVVSKTQLEEMKREQDRLRREVEKLKAQNTEQYSGFPVASPPTYWGQQIKSPIYSSNFNYEEEKQKQQEAIKPKVVDDQNDRQIKFKDK